MRRPRQWAPPLAILTVLATASGLTAPAPVAGAAVPSGHFTGTLPDGSSWVADVPEHWNGTLLLYSHGFGPLVPVDAPDPVSAKALLTRGFALVGSSYAPGSMWAMNTAVASTLGAAADFGRRVARPKYTIAFGQSMGGLVSARIAETRAVDGALTTCSMVGGAADLNNYQLNGEHALAQLLAPEKQIKLTGFTTPDEANASGARLTDLVTDAQRTAGGRARIALASALLNLPSWFPGEAKPADDAGREVQQYKWLTAGDTLRFVMGGRYWIESAVGGNSAWNAGVDYADLLHRSADRPAIRALYRQAGLNLKDDLTRLTRTASIRAEPAALVNMLRTSVPAGRLNVPSLTLHTISDNLAATGHETVYADRVTRAGRARLLRQAYVDRAGHCRFTVAETLAAVEAIHARTITGRWGTLATPRSLNKAAARLGTDGSAFLHHTPDPLVTHPVND
ncbi:alpha/beta hydrolase [Actinomadura graeca]|uniref:Alpha/beta hydrolase n=1 Tax=Actinomadura graeca TaxID=2750812 RepID=A0ABX8QVP8_9ACTN|nr:hypothetical protein [Actinomadura graeca]QXJ21802.1 alpha/beta hydrolase [Actinomadura graeca]